MRCADLADAASKATPPVLITQNEDCSKMLGELLQTTLDHLNVSALIGPCYVPMLSQYHRLTVAGFGFGQAPARRARRRRK